MALTDEGKSERRWIELIDEYVERSIFAKNNNNNNNKSLREAYRHYVDYAIERDGEEREDTGVSK